MKSPFPGVDPWLEQRWGDVYARLMVYMSDEINEQLPGDLEARVEECITVDSDEYSRRVYPDVEVTQTAIRTGHTPTPSSTLTVTAPHVFVLPDELPTQRHIEIIDRNGGRVVTAIELLSPANKARRIGRQAYTRKQTEYLEGGVNLVEIDLIRQGDFIVAVPPELLPDDCRTPFIICIRRAAHFEEVEVIPVALREPLPNFAVPLRATDHDIVIPLQPLLDECYRRGRHASLDYSRAPIPPLDENDQSWADDQIRRRETTAE